MDERGWDDSGTNARHPARFDEGTAACVHVAPLMMSTGCRRAALRAGMKPAANDEPSATDIAIAYCHAE